MLPAGSSYESSDGMRLEVAEATPERIVFERLYRPRTGKVARHLHLDCAQTWEGVSGRAMVDVDGEEIELGPGDSAEAPIGVAHRDPHNPFEEDARVRFRLEPNPPFIDAYGEALAHFHTHDRLDRQGDMPILQVFVMLREFDGQSFVAGPPIAVQKAAIPVMAAFARMRGYRPRYED